MIWEWVEIRKIDKDTANRSPWKGKPKQGNKSNVKNYNIIQENFPKKEYNWMLKEYTTYLKILTQSG